MNNRFQEYDYRLIWRDTRPRRKWEVVRFDEAAFRHYSRSYADIYWGMARYTKDAEGLSAHDLLSLEYVCPLVFDIDWHKRGLSFRHIVDAAFKISRWLVKSLCVKSEDILIWYSGRGFHIKVPSEVLLERPTMDIEYEYKKVAKYLIRYLNLNYPIKQSIEVNGGYESREVYLCPIDLKIYGRNKLIRIPESINSRSKFKANLQKFYLPYSAIRTLAKKDSKDLQSSFKTLVSQPPWKGVWWI